MMKTSQSNSSFIQAYNVFFVVTLTVVSLFVMFMSARPAGFGKIEEDFFQKNLLIQNFNHLRIKLGDHVFNNVLVGKDGWMELTGGNLDDYQNVVNFSPETLQTVAQAIQGCQRYAREHNITFLIVVAPNKASIYPDKLPDQIQPLSNLSRLDQLNNYLRIHNIPEILDLRPALRDARKQQDVYYETGTHWNAYGAYVGYETIINALSQSHPKLKPYSAKFFRFRSKSQYLPSRGDRGVADMIQANYLISEPTLFPTRNFDEFFYKIEFPLPTMPLSYPGYHAISWIPNSHLPSLLIYHDSFGSWDLNNFLAMNFSRIFYVHRSSSPLFLNKQTIEQFSPDIMIYEVVERDVDVLKNDLLWCAKK